MMDGKSLPLAIGVIRDVDAPSYEEEVDKQTQKVSAAKPYSTLREMVLAGETWEVK